MKVIALIVIVLLTVLLMITLVIRAALIKLKRPSRKEELRRHLAVIYDSNGCDETEGAWRFRAIQHLVFHYGIQLQEVGYGQTTMTDIRERVHAAAALYKKRTEPEIIKAKKSLQL